MCAVKIEQETNEGQNPNWSQNWSKDCNRGVWTPLNIVLMIAGFIIFTPVGFPILVGLICGVTPWQIPRWIASWFEGMSDWSERASTKYQRRTRSGNHVFDEYQQIILILDCITQQVLHLMNLSPWLHLDQEYPILSFLCGFCLNNVSTIFDVDDIFYTTMI